MKCTSMVHKYFERKAIRVDVGMKKEYCMKRQILYRVCNVIFSSIYYILADKFLCIYMDFFLNK